MLTYQVKKTECWPCEWYGGPCWNGEKCSNYTSYYWRTLKEALAYCDKMNRELLAKHSSSSP